jgi:4-hydroxy-tetrahydrodipicolinate reductase
MKIALIGYGKMGKTIEGVILESKQDEIQLKVGFENIHEFTIENLQQCDVAIEFTQPESAVENIYKCFDAGVPVVVGTTAWLHRLDEVKKQCAEKNGALLFSPNFSIGVNIFWEASKKLAQLMNKQPQYKVHIEESHHTEKKDIPSGTAVKTAEILLSESDSKTKWTLDSTSVSESELLIVAKREPDVPGTHTVTYTSNVDEIQIKHEAFNRRGFAEGAILAARWLVGKKGVFEISDLLNDTAAL